MARRNGRPGDFLSIDEYYGVTRYGSQLKKDYWGVYAEKPLLRNPQEYGVPLSDPYPLPFYTGSAYEQTNGCIAEVAPLFVGLTNVPTNNNNAASQALNLNPGIGEMAVGCSFIIR